MYLRCISPISPLYLPRYAQLIGSPDSWHVWPMQIDTRNRDCGVTPQSVSNCTTYTPDVEPRQARYGRGWAGVDAKRPAGSTNYSGVLECPCTSDYGGDPHFYPGAKTKVITNDYVALPAGSCGSSQSIASAAECFAQVPARLHAPTPSSTNRILTVEFYCV